MTKHEKVNRHLYEKQVNRYGNAFRDMSKVDAPRDHLWYQTGHRLLHSGTYVPERPPPEPREGTWVIDRFGSVSVRRGEGWGEPGMMPFGKWEAMWEARGPLLECGEWGAPLPKDKAEDRWPDRCPFVATDPITTSTPRVDNWRCGHEKGHTGNHQLFTVEGEGTLFAGTWKHQSEVTRKWDSENPKEYSPGGFIPRRTGGLIDNFVFTLSDDECVISGRTPWTCQRRDDAHRKAQVTPASNRPWACPLHDDPAPEEPLRTLANSLYHVEYPGETDVDLFTHPRHMQARKYLIRAQVLLEYLSRNGYGISKT